MEDINCKEFMAKFLEIITNQSAIVEDKVYLFYFVIYIDISNRFFIIDFFY